MLLSSMLTMLTLLLSFVNIVTIVRITANKHELNYQGNAREILIGGELSNSSGVVLLTGKSRMNGVL